VLETITPSYIDSYKTPSEETKLIMAPNKSTTTDTETWRTSQAKTLLRDAIISGSVKKEDDVTKLHKSNPQFMKWPISRFKQNVKNLFAALEKEKENPKKEKWAFSKAKHLLRDAIITGAVKRGDDASAVQQSNPEYAKWPLKNFKTNMNNLLDAIALDYKRMSEDSIAYGNDLAIIMEYRRKNPLAQIPWHKSEAKALLEKDMNDSKHIEMDPRELHASRPEYKAFSLHVFRGHIYQNQKKQRNKTSRFQKKKKRLPPPPKYMADEVGVALIREL
jgi:hypothetical protein